MPDVIVIGGGVVGTTAAWQIAAAGADVVLLERGALASGATGKSQGLVLPPDHEELVPLWRESLELYGRLADEREFGFDRQPIGTLLLATDENQLGVLDAVPHSGERLDAAGVAAEEPGLAPGMAGGLLLAEGRRSDPGALAAAAAAEARAAGADIRNHVEVKRLLRRGVVTDAGRIDAAMVVLAAGAWSRPLARMLGHELEVRPVRGWIALVAPGPEVLRHAVYEAEYTAPEPPVPGGPVTLAELGAGELAERGAPPVHALGIHQNADGTVVVGASRSAALHEGAESLAGLHGNARRACAMVPGIAGREVVATWTGLRPFSHDGLPYIGRLDDGVVVCAGHGSEGILTGAGSGRLAAELALGRAPFTDWEPFRPDRGASRS
jgi:glycine/D-amino acid oxidase-like deaminating enzyme